MSSPWAEIASWLLLPAVLWLIGVGWSLAIEQVTRTALPDALLAPVGFVMPPAVGAILMSISTIVVAINAQFLRRLDLRS